MSDLASARRRGGLGRGLSSLLGEAPPEASVAGPGGAGVEMVAVGEVLPLPDQPRRHFDEDALRELADSIRARGVVQPIVVRRRGTGYQLVAGERRWRASKLAGLERVPAVVRDMDDGEAMEIALVENIQRRDLNALEEAQAYDRLMRERGASQGDIAALVHKSRSHVANLLRLLDLPEPVRERVADGSLSMGHARALIGAPDPAALAEQVVARGLSVREAEKLGRTARPEARRARRPAPAAASPINEDLAALERQLGDLLGLAVTIRHEPDGRGTVALGYANFEQLDMICQRLSGEGI